jgi:prepilin-type N-terminal cleavage/methylation domain-containing protein
MTTFTPPIDRSSIKSRAGAARSAPRAAIRAFSLVEVMVASALSALVLAGVLSAFLMLNRSTLVLATYGDMASEVAHGLEMFAQDARRATDIHWNSSQSVTLSVATASATTTSVTYAYDSSPSSSTYQCFYRAAGDSTSTAPRLALVHHVASDFAFLRYKLAQPGVADATATSDLETKRIAVSLRAAQLGSGAPVATQSAVSASYVLRNKRVSN